MQAAVSALPAVLARAARGSARQVVFTLVTMQVLVATAQAWVVAQDEKARNDRGSDSTEKAMMIIAAIGIATAVGMAIKSYVKSRITKIGDLEKQ